jgi:hypothetical protein
MKNVFDPAVTAELIHRIEALTPESPSLWGKMSVDQMLAHCCVAYEMAFTDKHPKANPVLRFLLKNFVKKGVVNDVPYKKNLPTTPSELKTKRTLRKKRDGLLPFSSKLLLQEK